MTGQGRNDDEDHRKRSQDRLRLPRRLPLQSLRLPQLQLLSGAGSRLPARPRFGPSVGGSIPGPDTVIIPVAEPDDVRANLC